MKTDVGTTYKVPPISHKKLFLQNIKEKYEFDLYQNITCLSNIFLSHCQTIF